MSNGDKRYLGDVLINEENYERQKQFFRDIIESYQWKFGGHFDASTLQEKTSEDFATREQGEKADMAILSPLLLGKTEIANISDSQYIYTDAILLDREIAGLNEVDWYKNLENDDVTNALIDIYEQVIAIQHILQENIDQKLDQNTYNNFLSTDYTPFKETVSGTFQTVINENGEEEVVLNASLVNGIRFILITQEDYDNLPAAKKNFWRNVFIIKDSAEIPLDYSNPFELDLSDGYQFRVHDGELQVSNRIDAESDDDWKTLCSLESLLDEANIDNLIDLFISNNDYVIYNESLLNSLKEISSNDIDSDWDDYPFLSSSLHDIYIKDIKINGSTSNVISTINSSTNFKSVNLQINNLINDSLETINSSITQINSLNNQLTEELNQAQNDILSIENQIETINSKNNTQDTSLNEINNKLITINNNITALNTNMNNQLLEIQRNYVRNIDSGWVNLGYYNGFQSYGGNQATWNQLRCRKLNGVVTISGIIENKWAMNGNSEITIAKMSDQTFWPPNKIGVLMQGSLMDHFLLEVRSDNGEIRISRYGHGGSNVQIPKGAWLHICITYIAR